jgi:hypothetical protein
MKIDVFDGSISFARGTVLRAEDRETFLGTDLGRNSTQKLVNKEWWHVGIRPEPGVAATLIFRGNRLDSIKLLFEIPEDKSGEWTVELEQSRKAMHDRWLRAELGMPPYTYGWGIIASEFDAKAVVSEIIVMYEH